MIIVRDFLIIIVLNIWISIVEGEVDVFFSFVGVVYINYGVLWWGGFLGLVGKVGL